MKAQNNNRPALPDVYFDPAYGRLYETIEQGVCETFSYSDENGAVQNVYIKRAIPWLVDGVQYFDIITPYGYGGPVVLHATGREKLLDVYWQAWTAHCHQARIVCEFVRFHPLVRNHLDFGVPYAAAYNRNTLAIELTDDFEATEFTSKCRNAIRKAEKLGVVCTVDEACASVDTFCALYHKTMAKDVAEAYYFFSLDYFHAMREALAGRLVLINALLDGKTIASSLFMLSEGYMHYHLSATDSDYYGYAANNLILKAAASYGAKTVRQWLHLGGGLTASEADNLFKFKRSFARGEKNLKEFWTGRAIYDETVYSRIVGLRRGQGDFDGETRFFPAYRASL
ncbi:MAG TPA: GNAT family N-acetyltransferase [Clostridia bacterium]|nr:GNAT family N-acetyltransferase [Clostridia bacterium]